MCTLNIKNITQTKFEPLFCFVFKQLVKDALGTIKPAVTL